MSALLKYRSLFGLATLKHAEDQAQMCRGQSCLQVRAGDIVQIAFAIDRLERALHEISEYHSCGEDKHRPCHACTAAIALGEK